MSHILQKGNRKRHAKKRPGDNQASRSAKGHVRWTQVFRKFPGLRKPQ